MPLLLSGRSIERGWEDGQVGTKMRSLSGARLRRVVSLADYYAAVFLTVLASGLAGGFGSGFAAFLALFFAVNS
jgi:hypothetical protein